MLTIYYIQPTVVRTELTSNFLLTSPYIQYHKCPVKNYRIPLILLLFSELK